MTSTQHETITRKMIPGQLTQEEKEAVFAKHGQRAVLEALIVISRQYKNVGSRIAEEAAFLQVDGRGFNANRLADLDRKLSEI